MTSFLTFAVQSLNLNNSLPVQSLYFPLISVYFMISIFVTFYSLIWFWSVNNFLTKNFPKPIEKIAELIQACLFCRCIKKKSESDKVKPDKSVVITDLVTDEKKQIETKLAGPSMSQENKCNKCDMCSKCKDKTKEEKDKEEKKKKKKENTESLVNALNILMFIFMAILLGLLHLVIWIRCYFEK